MSPDDRYRELLDDLRAALAEEGVGQADPADRLGSIIGTLAAVADRDSLREAVSATQVRIRQEAGEAQPHLILGREVLRAASLVRAGEIAAESDREVAGGVRRQVLQLLRDRSEARLSELASELALGLPQVSRALAELAESGAVTRADAESLDGRERCWRAVSRAECRGQICSHQADDS